MYIAQMAASGIIPTMQSTRSPRVIRPAGVDITDVEAALATQKTEWCSSEVDTSIHIHNYVYVTILFSLLLFGGAPPRCAAGGLASRRRRRRPPPYPSPSPS